MISIEQILLVIAALLLLSIVGSKASVRLGVPAGALIALVGRGEEFIVPNGDTVLRAGGRLHVLADSEELASLRSVVERRAG